MAESMEADALSIYDFITENNLAGIRSLLNPLTLRHRQTIVCQTVSDKPLLVHACELGFKCIVKYLVDECEADVADGYSHRYTLLPPLRVAINNLDIALLSVLMSRGAFTADTTYAMACTVHALKKKYFCIFSVLSNFIDTIESLVDIPEFPDLLAWLANMDLNNAYSFLRASASGGIRRMKSLLSNCMDPKATNHSEDNALCLTILNARRNAEHFLLNYRVFSIKDHVRALELCGAKFIAFSSSMRVGLRCWRKATRIRTENLFGVSDKVQNKLQTDLGLEFTSEEQLNMMENNDADIYVQALIVFLRLLSPSSQVLQDAFVNVPQLPAFQKDLWRAIKILAKLSQFPYYPDEGVSSPSGAAIATLKPMFTRQLRSDPSKIGELLSEFRYLMDVINKGNWEELLSIHGEFYPAAYVQLLKQVLYNITALSKFNLGSKRVLVSKGLSKILKWHCDPYPTTLLHLAIENRTRVPVIISLLTCSDDVNCTDNNKNTAMHTLSFLRTDHAYILRLVTLLADAGCHIDSVNKYGITPFMIFEFKGVIRNPLKFLSLKCLAAQTIIKNGISVPEVYPQNLFQFLKLHRK